MSTTVVDEAIQPARLRSVDLFAYLETVERSQLVRRWMKASFFRSSAPLVDCLPPSPLARSIHDTVLSFSSQHSTISLLKNKEPSRARRPE